MIINEAQHNYIETNLTFYGIKQAALREDLIDHIATYIERVEEGSFEDAYQQAIQNLGGYAALQQMQSQMSDKQLMRKILLRNKVFYMLSSFNMMLLASGFLFKICKWPFANIMLVCGFALLIFGTIPFWFYQSYKKNEQKIILLNR